MNDNFRLKNVKNKVEFGYGGLTHYVDKNLIFFRLRSSLNYDVSWDTLYKTNKIVSHPMLVNIVKRKLFV